MHLKNKVNTPLGVVTVSTVKLPDTWYETCLFGPGASRVVDSYNTEKSAKDGHAGWVATVADWHGLKELA